LEPISALFNASVPQALAKRMRQHQGAFVSRPPRSTMTNDWPSFVPNWLELDAIDNLKKATQEYRSAGILYHASLDLVGSIRLQNSELTLDAFDVDDVVEVTNMGEHFDDVRRILKCWAPRNPNGEYLGGITHERAFLHTVIGDVMCFARMTVL
jgi:hypothetical protein